MDFLKDSLSFHSFDNAHVLLFISIGHIFMFKLHIFKLRAYISTYEILSKPSFELFQSLLQPYRSFLVIQITLGKIVPYPLL